MDQQQKISLRGSFPQNYIIGHPLQGAAVIAVFTLVFALLYRPLGAHASRYLGYELTMAVYSLISAAALYLMINLLVRVSYFSKPSEWTLEKELFSIFILLFGTGVTIYLAGFIIEGPAERWNLPTFLNSLTSAFLIGILPFLFFTVISYLRQVSPETAYEQEANQEAGSAGEEKIHITSQLKKESLSFYPGQLLYAESESNYVNFYLLVEGKVKKKVIRNSISDVEQQLGHVPYLYRTHRAFIVNLKHIRSKKGNSLGYRLRLRGTETEIPVSRNNTRNFSKLVEQYH